MVNNYSCLPLVYIGLSPIVLVTLTIMYCGLSDKNLPNDLNKKYINSPETVTSILTESASLSSDLEKRIAELKTDKLLSEEQKTVLLERLVRTQTELNTYQDDVMRGMLKK